MDSFRLESASEPRNGGSIAAVAGRRQHGTGALLASTTLPKMESSLPGRR